MAIPKKPQSVLAFLVICGGIYSLIYAVVGDSAWDIGDKKLAQLDGCYFVEEQQLFRISGRTIFAGESTFGFQGKHDKGTDVLVVDGPVLVIRRPQMRLIRQGTITKVPISYARPISLELSDETDEAVKAYRAPCR